MTIGLSPIGVEPLAVGATVSRSRSREVAMQGLGYGQGSIALQGFYRRQDEAIIVLPDFAPTWGPKVYPKKAPRRRDRDDDVLLFLLR